MSSTRISSIARRSRSSRSRRRAITRRSASCYADLAAVSRAMPADRHGAGRVGARVRRAGAIASAGGRPMDPSLARSAQPFYRYALPFVLFIVPFALLVGAADAVAARRWRRCRPPGTSATPRAMVEQIPCVTTPPMPARFAEEEVVLPARTTCPPDYAVMRVGARERPRGGGVCGRSLDAVSAARCSWPQQAVVFPTLDASFIHEDSLFRDYYRLFDDRMRAVPRPAVLQRRRDAGGACGVRARARRDARARQPDALRRAPPCARRAPEQYTLRYDNARWAVYEASRNAN